MFFYASKILQFFIYPLFTGLVLLVLAFLLRGIRRKRLFEGIFLCGIIILYIFSIEPVTDLLMKPLERMHMPPANQPLSADAIVVLGGDVRKVVYPRKDVELGGNRMLKAIRLFRERAAPLIIMTGRSGNIFNQEFVESVVMKKFAVEFGVPAGKIIIETGSRNTRENAVNTKKILDRLGAKRIILVTSALHMPRAYALFRHLGLDVLPAPTDFRAVDEGYDPFSFVPQAGNLARSTRAIREYVGILVYWLMGWI
jgi:uncharacterized SAM-binding protein YcdF (DUF218 family)